MNRREFLRLSAVAAGAALLAACGGGAQSSSVPPSAPSSGAASPAQAAGGSGSASASGVAKAPKTGGTFTIAHDADLLLGADTMKSTLTETTAVTSAINGSGNLVLYDRLNIYKIAPGVAESWESSPDFSQWTFKIRDNVKWHDGTPFTAQDAKWWLDLAVNGTKVGDKTRPPAVWVNSLGIASTSLPDSNHLAIKLKNASPQFLTVLGSPINQIGAPRHLMQPLIDQGKVDVAPQDVNYVGLGPFKMASYQKGSRIRLKRNELYWEKDDQGRQLPYLDAVEFPIMPQADAQDYAFVNNQLDMGCRGSDHNLTKDRRDQYTKALGDKVQFTNIGFSASSIIFNTLKSGPFQDLRVRKAVALWVDKAAFSPIGGGLTIPETILDQHNPFTSPDFMTWPGFNPATRQQDVAMAKQLMADAGFANGFSTTLVERDITQQTGVFIQGQLAGLGIKADMKIVDNAGWTQSGYARNYDLFDGSTAYAFIPEQTEALLNVASKTPTGGGAGAYEDPKVADLFTQLHANATDMQKRVDIWRTLEKYILVDQAYNVPLQVRPRVIPYRSYVQGLYPPPENPYHNLDFVTVWLDK